MRGSNCLMCRRPHPDRALFRRANIWDALTFVQKSRSGSRHSQKIDVCLSIIDQKIQAPAFKVLLVGGMNTELAALRFLKNRAPVQDILNISRFSDFINYQKLRSRTRQVDFLYGWTTFVSSKIALSLETSSKFRRFIFIKIDQNRAPMRSIRETFDH